MKQHLQMSVEISPLHVNKHEIRNFSVDAPDGLAVGCKGWKWCRSEVGHRCTGCKHSWHICSILLFTSTPLLLIIIFNCIIFLILSILSLKPGSPINYLQSVFKCSISYMFCGSCFTDKKIHLIMPEFSRSYWNIQRMIYYNSELNWR